MTEALIEQRFSPQIVMLFLAAANLILVGPRLVRNTYGVQQVVQNPTDEEGMTCFCFRQLTVLPHKNLLACPISCNLP